MSAIERNLSSVPQMAETCLTNSRSAFIGCVAVGLLTATMFAVSAWMNVTVANAYGAINVLKYSPLTIAIPIAITLLAGWGIIRYYKSNPAPAPILSNGQKANDPKPAHSDAPSGIGTSSGAALGDELFMVTSIYPGFCVALKVKVGDLVSAGDPICTVECMKMYTDITCDLHAGQEGRVAEILIKPNETFSQGAPLVKIEAVDNKKTG